MVFIIETDCVIGARTETKDNFYNLDRLLSLRYGLGSKKQFTIEHYRM